jgi:DNA polymerase III gamma/tau subunit
LRRTSAAAFVAADAEDFAMPFEKSEQLITRYRPRTFDEVRGNTRLIQSLATAVRGDAPPRGYFFTGPAGVGKTSLAQIVAKELHAWLIPVDAAMDSGVNCTRHVVNVCKYTSLLPEPNRFFFLDETQNLSPKAFQPLLGLIEHPPSDVFVALATTDDTNIPDTIRSRCFPAALGHLTDTEIEDLVFEIADLEGWIVLPDVLRSIVKDAKGGARMALTLLEAWHEDRSLERAVEARQTLNQIQEEKAAESAQKIVEFRPMPKNSTSLLELLKKLREVPTEEIDRLERVLNAMDGPATSSRKGKGRGNRAPMSEETREKIRAAQAKRWADYHKTHPKKKKAA